LWKFERFKLYLQIREATKQTKVKFRNMVKEGEAKKAKEDQRGGSTRKRANKQITTWKMFKADLNHFLPGFVLWTTRVLLFFQSYMYHKGISLFHILYTLLSFVVPIRVTMFVSVIVMLPLYTWEFVMVYGNNIPILAKSAFFIKYGSYFSWDLKIQSLEQTLYYFILTCFFMMISCLKLTFQYD